MINQPLLSICIPTYKRPSYLAECLDALTREDLSGVEILVRDNGSHDDTESVLRRYQVALGLRYEMGEVNEGPDRNFGRVLRMATGSYVWLLGDDDVVTTGSVTAIKRELLARKPLLLQVGFIQATSTLKPLQQVSPIRAGQDDQGKVLNKAAYIEAQPNVSLLFAFMSSFVFSRSCWDYGETAEKWYGTLYVHVYQIHSALAASQSPRIAHLAEPGVFARGNVPNSVTANVGEIMWLDARTLANLCRTVYGNDPAFQCAFSRVFQKVYSLRTITSVLAQTGKAIDEPTASALAYLGFSPLKLKLAAYLGQPFLRNFALALARKS